MKLVLIAAAALALAGCTPDMGASAANPVDAADLVGVATVIDGDTLEIRGERVRLYGIDAFEAGQRCRDEGGARVRCGREAAMALDAMVSGRTVYCDETGRDRWDRRVARCRTSETADVSEALVAKGWAIAFTRYSQRYVAQESQARQERRGAWGGAFDAPSDWRNGRRTDASS